MTEEQAKERRSPVFRAIAAMLLLLLIYPISFGPACWIVTRYDPPLVIDVFHLVYGSLIDGLLRVPQSFDEPISWYLSLGAPKGSQPPLGTWINTKCGKRSRMLTWVGPRYTYTAGSVSID